MLSLIVFHSFFKKVYWNICLIQQRHKLAPLVCYLQLMLVDSNHGMLWSTGLVNTHVCKTLTNAKVRLWSGPPKPEPRHKVISWPNVPWGHLVFENIEDCLTTFMLSWWVGTIQSKVFDTWDSEEIIMTNRCLKEKGRFEQWFVAYRKSQNSSNFTLYTIWKYIQLTRRPVVRAGGKSASPRCRCDAAKPASDGW